MVDFKEFHYGELILYISDKYLLAIDAKRQQLVNPTLRDFDHRLIKLVSLTKERDEIYDLVHRSQHKLAYTKEQIVRLPPQERLPNTKEETIRFCKVCFNFCTINKELAIRHVNKEHQGVGFVEVDGYRMASGPRKFMYFIKEDDRYNKLFNVKVIQMWDIRSTLF